MRVVVDYGVREAGNGKARDLFRHGDFPPDTIAARIALDHVRVVRLHEYFAIVVAVAAIVFMF